MPSTGSRVSDLRGVLFDIGGVVSDSPLHEIARYERERGLPANAINRVVVTSGDTGAWSRLERGEVLLPDFPALFESDCRACGIEIDAGELMRRIAAAAVPRPKMLDAVSRLRAHGLRVAALTNNWRRDGGSERLRDRFDAFVESCVVGLRKPDPRIYAVACEQLGLAPTEVVFLDDIGRNLKAARELGMTTIKVDDPDTALRELGALVGIDLTR
jgi:putative hydrolase of the HAD superfamily